MNEIFYFQDSYSRFERLLSKVYGSINLASHFVIRSYLVKVLPQEEDAIHYDSGYFVTRSHRLLLVLQASTACLIIGKSRDELAEVKLELFDLIEVNNRAFHGVVNRDKEGLLVYLIIEYVEMHTYETELLKAVNVKSRNEVDWMSLFPRHSEPLRDISDANEYYLVRQRLQFQMLMDSDEMKLSEYLNYASFFFPNQTSSTMNYKHGYRVQLAKDPNNQLKYYLVPGAMKAATTTVWFHANELHPSILSSNEKELRAFTTHWLSLCDQKGNSLFEKYWNFGFLKTYKSQLRKKKPRKTLFGEVTPDYLLYGTEVYRRVQAVDPSTKVVVILRDPVERLWSRFKMDYLLFNITTKFVKSLSDSIRIDHNFLKACNVNAYSTTSSEFESCYLSILPLWNQNVGAYYGEVVSNPNRPLQSHFHPPELGAGLYCFQIELLLRIFPRNQVQILKYEEFDLDTAGHMDSIFAFIDPSTEVEKKARKEARYNTYNNPRYKKLLPDRTQYVELLNALKKYFSPFNERLHKLFPEHNFLSWNHNVTLVSPDLDEWLRFH